MWIAGNIPNTVDVEWLKRGGGIVGHDHPPAYRFNAGQKAIYWIVVLGGALVAVTGYVLMFPFYGTNLHDGNCPGRPRHGCALFIAVMLGHIYIGTIGMEGAFEAMGRHRGRQLGEGAPQPVAGGGERAQGSERVGTSADGDAGRISRSMIGCCRVHFGVHRWKISCAI